MLLHVDENFIQAAVWEAWAHGEGRCPYCINIEQWEFETICDCWQVERETGRWS